MGGPGKLPELRTTLLELPARGLHPNWSYGTAVINVPGSTEMLVSLPSGASRTPWAVVDAVGEEVRVGSALPGDLRAALFPASDAPDPRWWVLGVHGIGRVDRFGALKVEDVIRARVGRYPCRLFPLGEDLVAIGSRLSGNVVLMSVHTGERVAGFRLPQADNPVTLSDGLVRVFAPEAGMAYDVDTSRPKVVRRHPIPKGKGERLISGRLTYFSGRTEVVRVLGASESPPPGVPAVLGAGVEAGTVVGHAIVPKQLVELDAITLDSAGGAANGAAVNVPATALEVLGVDADGNVVVANDAGFLVVDRSSGQTLAQHHDPGGLVGAGMVPGRNLVVLATDRKPVGTLAIIAWENLSEPAGPAP